MTVVLDCSMTMSWCFLDEASALGNAALEAVTGGDAVVPGNWPLEVANVLALAERRGRILPARVVLFLGMLQGLPIRVDQHTGEKAFTDTLDLARRHQITAYDAAYLELAIRQGASLATLDARLRAAAVVAGVAIFTA